MALASRLTYVSGSSYGAAATTFTASCLLTDAVGDCVYMTGDYSVARADITDASKVPAVGVIISKPTTSTAIVRTHGEITGVYTGLVSGKVYFLGATGVPVVSPPVAGLNPFVYIQKIGLAISSNVLLVTPNFSLVKVLP